MLTMVMGYTWQARYAAIPAGSLPFSIGALLYFLKRESWRPLWLSPGTASCAVLFALMMVNAIAGTMLQASEQYMPVVELMFYLGVLISALLVYGLALGGRIFHMPKKLDKWLGDFSYPVYLLHWQAGTIASALLFGEVVSLKDATSPLAWLLTALLLFVVCLGVIKLVDAPVEILRDRVRGKPAL